MTLVSPELGKKFEELRHGMISNKVGETSSTNRAEVRLIKDQNSEAKVRTFTLVQDEPESVWGTGKVQRPPTNSSPASASARTSYSPETLAWQT